MYTCYHEKIYPDVEYLTAMYPNSVAPFYEKIADICDKLEYEGSLMFDEFPDYERILGIVSIVKQSFPDELSNQNSWFSELITIMILNEFLHRRIRKKEF